MERWLFRIVYHAYRQASEGHSSSCAGRRAPPIRAWLENLNHQMILVKRSALPAGMTVRVLRAWRRVADTAVSQLESSGMLGLERATERGILEGRILWRDAFVLVKRISILRVHR